MEAKMLTAASSTVVAGSCISRPSHRFAVKNCGEIALCDFRNSLIRQEDSIIFAVLERAQLCYNAETYNPNAFPVKGYTGSMLEYMIKETEKLHAAVQAY